MLDFVKKETVIGFCMHFEIAPSRLGFFLGCFAATQLARQLQQERKQVVCSNIKWYAVIGKPGSARPEGTPAMDLGLEGKCTHM